MINILPPELKRQVEFSRRNSVLARYGLLLTVAGGLLAITLFVTHAYADRQLAEYRAALEDRQQELATYHELQTEVDTLDRRLRTINQLYAQQTRFSSLLEDLAAVLPPGSYINSIVLTGESDQPVQVLITVSSFSQAGLMKNALSSSDRIESVDIQTITASGESNFSVNVVMAFSDGGAR